MNENEPRGSRRNRRLPREEAEKGELTDADR
jgi:hypothetical protein